VTSEFLRIFTAANERLGLDSVTSTNHREGNSEKGFSKHLKKLVSKFKEANKKLLIVKGSKKRIHRRKVIFRPSKNYPSRDTVPFSQRIVTRFASF
jgi:hypothetical protein